MKQLRLFGTSGIRGDAKKLFTNQLCFDISRTFIKFLKQKGVENKILALGMDPRPSSQRIKETIISGLDPSWKIWDEGIIPTPALNYFTKQKNCAGIMISGSHIDLELNGLKFFIGDEEINKDEEKIIEEIYSQEKERVKYQKKQVPVKKESQAKDLYIQMMADLARGDFSGLKVVIDPGNGAQTKTTPNALEKLGVKVIKINADLTKTMLVRDTETKDAFSELRKAVVDQKADLGVGYDADGDRAIFVDEKGKALSGGTSCALIAKYSQAKIVATPINTSSVVEHINKKIIRTKVGVLYVVEAMKKHNSFDGFESNGGYISGEIFYGRDGGTATIKILNLLKQTKQSLNQLADQLPGYFIIKDKVDCPRKINSLIFDKVKSQYTDQKTEDLDGIKVWLDNDSWVLFRPSGNAPEFRVFAESKNEEKANRLAQEGMTLVKSIIKQNES